VLKTSDGMQKCVRPRPREAADAVVVQEIERMAGEQRAEQGDPRQAPEHGRGGEERPRRHERSAEGGGPPHPRAELGDGLVVEIPEPLRLEAASPPTSTDSHDAGSTPAVSPNDRE
jgi:hypothetical protein